MRRKGYDTSDVAEHCGGNTATFNRTSSVRCEGKRDYSMYKAVTLQKALGTNFIIDNMLAIQRLMLKSSKILPHIEVKA